MDIESRAAQLGRVASPIPGDGWCLLHAVAWYTKMSNSWNVEMAAGTYLLALEWLTGQLTGPRAEAIAFACMPERVAELELHREFLQRRGIVVGPDMPQCQIVLWSKITAVAGRPRMLDSYHHGTSVELWALSNLYGFDALIWSTQPNQNLWICASTLEHVDDAQAQELVEARPEMLQVIHQQMGHTGHYGLLRTERPGRLRGCISPWLGAWFRGIRALQQHIGILPAQPCEEAGLEVAPPQQTCRLPCAQCGRQVPVADLRNGWCCRCAYPPCQGCGGRRPQDHQHHAKDMPEYMCRICKSTKCAKCKGPRNEGQEYTSLRSWCRACAFPPCAGGCGAFPPCQKCHQFKPKTPMSEPWCEDCAFPDCRGCRCPRPRQKIYHARRRGMQPWKWKCLECANTCSACHAPLARTARRGTWCAECAYPPCEGCGRARPKQRRYHAKHTPAWKCPACSGKQCGKCGKSLGAKVRVGAWCPACAFPPCAAGCGRPRASHRQQYHAKRMPEWFCPDCNQKAPDCPLGQLPDS